MLAVEVRDAALPQTRLADVLRAHGATYCLLSRAAAAHRFSAVPMLRRFRPGRWSAGEPASQARRPRLRIGHKDYAPFDRLVDEDLETRQVLGPGDRGHHQRAVMQRKVSINNKAEGSAPLSVR